MRSGVSGDVAWLVMLERAQVRFVERAEARRSELWVTEIFLREGDHWLRTDRQADLLVDRHGLTERLW